MHEKYTHGFAKGGVVSSNQLLAWPHYRNWAASGAESLLFGHAVQVAQAKVRNLSENIKNLEVTLCSAEQHIGAFVPPHSAIPVV